MLKGVYCFITASVDCAKAGVTALLKPEPGSDLFVDLLGGALITAMASIFSSLFTPFTHPSSCSYSNLRQRAEAKDTHAR